MWNYEQDQDWYRHAEKPDYIVEVEMNKAFPGWKTFHLSNESSDFTRKLISTDLHSALDEADTIIEGGEPESFKQYPEAE